jgi:hypothetical protein
MRNVVHSAIRESIHSVSYVCINRLLNFVNQNKIVEKDCGNNQGGNVDGSVLQVQPPCSLRY